jgi:hypothetical protein
MEEGIDRISRELVKSMKDPVLPCRMIQGQGPGMYKVILTLTVFARPVIASDQWFGVLKYYVLFRL